jgi:hypothetical protein
MELCCKKQEAILKLLDSATVYKEIEKKKKTKMLESSSSIAEDQNALSHAL